MIISIEFQYFFTSSEYKRFLIPEDNFLSGEHEIKDVYCVSYGTIYEVQSTDYSFILNLYKRQ